MAIVPGSTPRRTLDECEDILSAFPQVTSSVKLLGVRGYYRDTMGKSGVNDRGIYDDAIFLISPNVFMSFNANTDPGGYRAGTGTGAKKGMANLNTGVWSYQIGLHRQSYTALVQAAAVVVTRDGDPPYADKGWFGINIHKGGKNTVSSLGCQTIYPTQWTSFIETVRAQMKTFGQKTIPYVLVKEK